ncbi:hypothetical protein [Epilithonimonas arachidiradicis]|uniref:Uncharacterized protein n=1 Tax=Epilithonimonas arachidiradicis TaxID=1617282 RepID=A0A420DBW3_9FLAO|nr:hypothetical protein [Epilithonimonas arachidiradicis]RKE89023.1 hypothetical protein BXY58_1157 [Epilithonimonas arachidiradicis]GGG53165.1 hypothetical protein GCM10007332_13550 [Epilithonimonas arachidiradicis]
METIKLSIEIEKGSFPLVKKFLENIKGIVNVEEEDELLDTFLKMESDFLDGKLETVSEEDFKKNIEDKVCELYSKK